MKKSVLRKTNITKPIITTIVALVIGLLIPFSCKTTQEKQDSTQSLSKTIPTITEQEVLDAQKAWGDGMVQIGKVRSEGGDFRAAVQHHVESLYGYDLGPVLFKPTTVSRIQFRTKKEGALSYFTGDQNQDYPEDLRVPGNPIIAVRWENAGIKIIGDVAIAMGNYYFTRANEEGEGKVEYAFAYTKDNDGNLRIIMHDSSIPYKRD